MPVQIVAWGFQETTDGVSICSTLPSEFTASTPSEALEHLTEEREHVLNITWELDEDITPLLKLLGEPVCRQLHDTEETTIRPYKLTYKPGKLFSVFDYDSGYLAEFYSLSQFLPDFSPPQSLEQLYQWGRIVHKTIQDIGLNPTRLVSIGNIFANGILKTLNIPTWKDLPEKVAEYSLYCAKRQWVEALQLGYWKEATDFDLTGAYPRRMIDLIDHRYCTWHQWKEDVPIDAVYGYFKCRFNINKQVKLHPLITYVNGVPMCCTGEFEDYINLNSLKWFNMNRERLGSYQILDGVYCVPDRPDFYQYQMTYPLKTILPRLLSKRTKYDRIRDLIVKVGINAIGGYLSMVTTRNGQEILGDWCNPCWASEFTTDTRLEVCNFIYRHQLEDHTLHISVDGLLSDQNAIFLLSDVVAGWRESYQGPALILSSGRVFLGPKCPGGIPLTLALHLIENDAGNCSWSTIEQRRVTLGEALQDDHFNQLGNAIDTKSTLHLFASHKRYFPKVPNTGHELLTRHFTSVPFHLKQEGANL